jgi:hypothetical protein
MEVVLTGRDTLRARMVLFQVNWLIKALNLSNYKSTLEVIPKRGLNQKTGGVGLSGRNGTRIGFAYDTKLKDDLFRTVSHEMIHIKQLLKGQLRYEMDGNEEVVFWRGKRFDTSKCAYIDRPWEREAYSKQEILTHQFCDFVDEIKVNGRRSKV